MYYVVRIMYRKTFTIIPILLILTTCYLLHATYASADFNLGIFPPIIRIDANAPADIRHEILIKNGSDSSVTLSIALKPFTAQDTSGTVRYLTAKDVFPGVDTQIYNKIQILEDGQPVNQITLGPQQQKTLMLKIGLPKDEPPSDYYFSIIFKSKDIKEDQAGAQIAGGIASNVLLSIGPKGTTQGFLDFFYAPWFVTTGPIPFTVTLHNLSKHFIIPRGEIIIKNMFGQIVGDVNLLSVNVLANSSRNLIDSSKQDDTHAVWNEKFLFGPYKATLIIALSPEGPIIRRSIYFLAIPIEYLIGAFVVILVGWVVTARVKKRLDSSM